MRTIKRFFLSSVLILLAIMPVSCSSTDSAVGSYDSTSVYNRPLYSNIAKQSMAYEGGERNPVIVVHGFLGAKLKNFRTGENVWGEFKGTDILKGYSNEHLKGLSDANNPAGPGRDDTFAWGLRTHRAED